MTKRRNITLSLVFTAMLVFLLWVIWGDNGWVDLKRLQETHEALGISNARLTRENAQMYDVVGRLQKDTEYIENIARQELGMVRPDEVIFKFYHGKNNDK